MANTLCMHICIIYIMYICIYIYIMYMYIYIIIYYVYMSILCVYIYVYRFNLMASYQCHDTCCILKSLRVPTPCCSAKACANCGHMLQADSVYCRKCGHKREQARLKHLGRDSGRFESTDLGTQMMLDTLSSHGNDM